MNCTGLNYQIEDCPNNPACPIHGNWTNWSDWGECSKTCGSGYEARSRNCTDPTPQFGGDNCTDHDIETKYCHEANCPST